LIKVVRDSDKEYKNENCYIYEIDPHDAIVPCPNYTKKDGSIKYKMMGIPKNKAVRIYTPPKKEKVDTKDKNEELPLIQGQDIKEKELVVPSGNVPGLDSVIPCNVKADSPIINNVVTEDQITNIKRNNVNYIIARLEKCAEMGACPDNEDIKRAVYYLKRLSDLIMYCI
jgi:hypothetical protein